MTTNIIQTNPEMHSEPVNIHPCPPSHNAQFLTCGSQRGNMGWWLEVPGLVICIAS